MGEDKRERGRELGRRQWFSRGNSYLSLGENELRGKGPKFKTRPKDDERLKKGLAKNGENSPLNEKEKRVRIADRSCPSLA